MPLRAFTPTELVLTERRRLERPMMALVWLGVATFSLAEGSALQWLFIGVATFAVALNFLAAHYSREVYVSRLMVNLGVAVATLALAAEVYLGIQLGNLHLLSALGHYLILIELCKLFERKTNRDYGQMFALSTLLMVSAALLTPEFWLLGATLAYLALACYTAMVLTLKRGLDAAAEARLATEGGPMAPQRVAWNVTRVWPAWPLRTRVVGAIAWLLTCGAVAFLLTPRLDALEQNVMSQGDLGPSISGFGRSMSLKKPGAVYLSDRIVLEMSIRPAHEGGQVPSTLYLRGQTFHIYASNQWTNPRELPSPSTQPAPPEDLLARAYVLDARMVPVLLPNLFTPGSTCRVSSDVGSTIIGWDMNVKLGSGSRMARYQAWALPEPLTAAEAQGLAELQRAYDIPPKSVRPSEVSPRVAALAKEWCGELLDQRDAARQDQQDARAAELDLRIAQRIAGRLRSECKYSLDFSDADPSKDALEDFLFTMRHGHCEYFASALTAMCQSLGVPARLAGGFHVDESNRSGDTILIRDRDAHAWTEVLGPQGLWVVVDATPSGFRPAPKQGFWNRIDDLWTTLRFKWVEAVLGYDARGQRNVMQWIGDTAGNAVATVRRAVEAVGESFEKLLRDGEIDRTIIRLALVLLTIGVVAEMTLLVRVLRRRAEWSAAGVRPEDTRFIRRMVELLEKHGLRRGSGQTLRDLAAAATQRLGLPADGLAGVVDLYYRIRWGGQLPTADQIAAAEQAVLQWRHDLRKSRKLPADGPDSH